jgi:hypothetical protein
MLERTPLIDLHTLLKACYFADKSHINLHNRPVFGATYRAMKFGPVPLEIYEMAKGDALWLAELEVSQYPWSLEGYNLRRVGNEPADLGTLSQSDMEALEQGFELSRGMTFTERTAATHGRDWQAANLGMMRYEDMIDDFEGKGEKVAYLREAGPRIRI